MTRESVFKTTTLIQRIQIIPISFNPNMLFEGTFYNFCELPTNEVIQRMIDTDPEGFNEYWCSLLNHVMHHTIQFKNIIVGDKPENTGSDEDAKPDSDVDNLIKITQKKMDVEYDRLLDKISTRWVKEKTYRLELGEGHLVKRLKANGFNVVLHQSASPWAHDCYYYIDRPPMNK